MSKDTSDAGNVSKNYAAEHAVQRDPKWECVQAELAKPFSAKYISFKPGAVSDSGSGLLLWYIDARAVMDRLDQIAGPENWSFTWETVPAGTGRVAIHGSLRVFDVVKEDVGEAQDESEPFKSAVSDAFKRCAVHFGLGRYLYSMPQIWWPYDKQKRRFMKLEELDKFIESVISQLIELGGDASKLDPKLLQIEATNISQGQVRQSQGDRPSLKSTQATHAQQDVIRDMQIKKFGVTQDAKARYDRFQQDVIGRVCKRSEMTKFEADKIIKALVAMANCQEDAA